MRFDPSKVRIEPGHETRRWQSCDYFASDGTRLFHERAYMRSAPRFGFGGRACVPTPAQSYWLASGPGLTLTQWVEGSGTQAEIEALAAKHGGEALECFYAPEGADAYFLAFNDTDKALAFCQTEDFDRLAYPLKAGVEIRA